MSDDYISGLRADLVEAAARHAAHGTLGRTARPLHPRVWRPATIAGAAALAVVVAAVVLAVSTLSPPVHRVGRLDVVAVVPLGGQPADAAYGGGSLWVADFEGRVLRVDPASRRVLASTPVPGRPTAIAADDTGVWVVCEPRGGGSSFSLLRIDPRNARIQVQRRNTSVFALAAAGGATWVLAYARDDAMVGRLEQDGTISRGAGLPGGPSLAAGRDSLWALATDGTLTEVDATSGAVLNAIHGAVAVSNYDMPENAVAADDSGAWVTDTHEGKVVHVVAGRVVKRISVAPRTGAIARGADAVWVATADASRLHNGLARIDPDRGAVTAAVDIGYHVPKAVVPVGAAVWVVASDGTATIVRIG